MIKIKYAGKSIEVNPFTCKSSLGDLPLLKHPPSLKYINMIVLIHGLIGHGKFHTGGSYIPYWNSLTADIPPQLVIIDVGIRKRGKVKWP